MLVPNPLVRVVLAGCLLAAVPAASAGLFGGPPEPGQLPSRFIMFEGLAGGFVTYSGGPWTAWSGRAVAATIAIHRFRAGAAVLDGDAGIGDRLQHMLLPVHVGYAMVSRPTQTPLWYGFLPDIYVEASGGVLDGQWRYSPAVRLAVCCDVSYCGLGVRLTGGWAWVETIDPEPLRERVFKAYAGVQVRALTFGVGF